jgi:hypothetical protein
MADANRLHLDARHGLWENASFAELAKYVEEDPDTIDFGKLEEGRRWVDARNSFLMSQTDGLEAAEAVNLATIANIEESAYKLTDGVAPFAHLNTHHRNPRATTAGRTTCACI